MAFLADLPCKGNFTNAATFGQGKLQVYLCDHDTRPPDDQVIRTDSTNILIRSLSLKKNKEESSKVKEGRGGKTGEDLKGKRLVEGGNGDVPSTKRQKTVKGGSGGSSNPLSERELQSMTVDRLRSLLKDMGASARGKKEELVARAKQLL